MSDETSLNRTEKAAHAAVAFDLYAPVPGLSPSCGAVFSALDFKPIRTYRKSDYIAPDTDPA